MYRLKLSHGGDFMEYPQFIILAKNINTIITTCILDPKKKSLSIVLSRVRQINLPLTVYLRQNERTDALSNCFANKLANIVPMPTLS